MYAPSDKGDLTWVMLFREEMTGPPELAERGLPGLAKLGPPFLILRGVFDGVGSLGRLSEEADVVATVPPSNSISHSRKTGRSRSSRVRVKTHLRHILSDFPMSGETARPMLLSRSAIDCGCVLLSNNTLQCENTPAIRMLTLHVLQKSFVAILPFLVAQMFTTIFF